MKKNISIQACLLILLIYPSLSAAADKSLLGMELPKDFKIFAPNSPWNTPIVDKPALDVDSALMIKNVKQVAKHLDANVYNWTIPLFVIDASLAPKKNVKVMDEDANPEVDPDQNLIVENVPLPDGVWADPEADGHLLLIDPKLHKSWDFSHARLIQGQWQASRVDTWDLTAQGFREPFKGVHWWTYGASGSGMPLAGGLIRIDEVKAGVIPHALAFDAPVNRKVSSKSVGKTTEYELCPPASRTDGTGIGKQYLYMGARLQLNPQLDLNKLGLSPAAKTVAVAMQKYGMYNSGTTEKDFVIYFQNLGAEDSEWKNYNFTDELRKIPLEEFRVLACKLVTKAKK